MADSLIVYETQEEYYAREIGKALTNSGIHSDYADADEMNSRDGALVGYSATIFVLSSENDHAKVASLLPYMPGLVCVVHHVPKPDLKFSTVGILYFVNSIPISLLAEVVSSRLQLREIIKQERAEKVAVIEDTGFKFIEETDATLNKRMNGAKIYGNLAVFGGLVILVGAVVAAIQYGYRLSPPSSQVPAIFIGTIVYNSVRGLVVVGLLVAISKYLFNVGKAWLTECLRNADRIHAINFGKFYLDLYKANIKGEELREVFENWNISTTSTFASLDANDHDPRLLEKTMELASKAIEFSKVTVAEKSKEKE